MFVGHRVASGKASTRAETSSTDGARYQELASRVRDKLAFGAGTTSIADLHVEVVGISESVESARQRHVASEGVLTKAVEDIEGINLEEVAAQILTLQTRLQASYQTTSILSQLTLTSFL